MESINSAFNILGALTLNRKQGAKPYVKKIKVLKNGLAG